MRGKLQTGRRGAAMVEFALGFIFFLVLLIGLFEFGRAVWMYTTVAHAARQGARYAMAHGSQNPATTDQIRAVVALQAVGLNSSQLEVNTSWNPANQRGATVQVQVRYPFEFVTSPLLVSQSTIRLGATSRMIVAN